MRTKKGKAKKPLRQRNGHMIRLTDRAYGMVSKAYALFLKKVRESPELYHVYAERRVTISEVLCVILEAACQE